MIHTNPECPCYIMDKQSGITNQGHWPKGKTTGYGEFGNGETSYEGVGPKDKTKGGASRFFYQAKSNKDLLYYLSKLITPKNGTILIYEK